MPIGDIIGRKKNLFFPVFPVDIELDTRYNRVCEESLFRRTLLFLNLVVKSFTLGNQPRQPTTTQKGRTMQSINQITRSKSWKQLESAVARNHGDLDLYNELETIVVSAPWGRQWVETGTNSVSEARSNGTQEYTAEACRTLIDIVNGGTEVASESTIREMGW